MRLVQLTDNESNPIGLYHFSDETTDGDIELWYDSYKNSEYDDFEEWLEEIHPDMEAERVFADEIYV